MHILDLTLWFMGNPEPHSVTGVARAELAHQPGVFTNIMGGGPIPQEFDVEDFAAAFVRFKNGATLVLEVSWLLHHDTQGEDMQMWLYGTQAGSHWPKGEIYRSQLRHAAAVQLHAEAHGRHAGAARAGVRRVRQGRR